MSQFFDEEQSIALEKSEIQQADCSLLESLYQSQADNSLLTLSCFSLSFPSIIWLGIRKEATLPSYHPFDKGVMKLFFCAFALSFFPSLKWFYYFERNHHACLLFYFHDFM
jgi:hypothetical protein